MAKGDFMSLKNRKSYILSPFQDMVKNTCKSARVRIDKLN